MIVRKLVVSDGRTERELLLVGTIVVGRDPSCQLNDLDPLLSRRHAEFVTTSKGVTVRDLKSRNGILVNGDKVPEHALKPGDVVQLGHLHVRYVEEAVVKSPEDHSRVRAKTETGIEVPTMAVPRPAGAPARAAAMAPTEAAPRPQVVAPRPVSDDDLAVTMAPAGKASMPGQRVEPPSSPASDDTDLDVTIAVPRSAAPPNSQAPAVPNTDLDATVVAFRTPPPPASHEDTDDTDVDVTVASPRRMATSPAPPSPAGGEVDPDATRLLWANATAVADDPDATVATVGKSLEDTHVPSLTSPSAATSTRQAPAPEARVVANMSLVVSEASPSCQTIIGARPDTIVGGHLSDLMTRILRFVATGDGPQSLSITVARATTSNTITVTFKSGTHS